MNSELVPYLCEQTFWYLYFKWHTLRRKRMLKIVSKTQNLLWSLHQMIHDQNCAILGMLLLLKLWGQPNQSELRFVSWPICKFGWRHLQLCTGSPKKKLLIEIKRSDIGDLDTVSAGGVYIVGSRCPFWFLSGTFFGTPCRLSEKLCDKIRSLLPEWNIGTFYGYMDRCNELYSE